MDGWMDGWMDMREWDVMWWDGMGCGGIGCDDPSIMFAHACSFACVCMRVLMCVRGEGLYGPADGSPRRMRGRKAGG